MPFLSGFRWCDFSRGLVSQKEHITVLESFVMLMLDELREIQNPESHKDIHGGMSSRGGRIRICLRLQRSEDILEIKVRSCISGARGFHHEFIR